MTTEAADRYQAEIQTEVVRRSRFCLSFALLIHLLFLGLDLPFFPASAYSEAYRSKALVILGLSLAFPFTYQQSFQRSPVLYSFLLYAGHVVADTVLFFLSDCNPNYFSSYLLSTIFLILVFPFHPRIAFFLSLWHIAGFLGAIIYERSALDALHLSSLQPTDISLALLLLVVGMLIALKGHLEERLFRREYFGRLKLEKATARLQIALKEQRSTQAMLIHTEKMASLGRLVAGIAHELNNPIHFIYGNLKPLEDHINTLLEGPVKSPTNLIHESRREIPLILADIRSGSIRVRDLVRDLRLFSHGGNNQSTSDANEVVDLHEIACQTQRLLNLSRQEKFSLVWNGPVPLHSVGTHSGWSQIFLNLFSNALDAMSTRPEGSQIDVSASVSEESLTLEIRDYGQGVAAKDEAHVFEPFYTTKPPGEGTGLGLSITHSLVMKMRGRIQMTSELGTGTVVHLAMPLLKNQQSEDSFVYQREAQA